jgi:hypothetical protein
MDLIEDSQLAINAYPGAKSDSEGALYLAVYGLLQALFLQQDAVAHLGSALGISISEDPELKSVREARNDIAGHPTKRRGKKNTFTTHTISRWSLSTDAIEVYSSDEKHPLYSQGDSGSASSSKSSGRESPGRFPQSRLS